MKDILEQLHAVSRETGARRVDGADTRTIVIRRRYDAPIDDVWDAITDPGRIARWFLPVSGDLRLGGSYQIEGNAGGEIVRCEPPHLLAVTWFFGPKAESPPKKTFLTLDWKVALSSTGRPHLSNSMPESRSIQGKAFSCPTATSTSSHSKVCSGSPVGMRFLRPFSS